LMKSLVAIIKWVNSGEQTPVTMNLEVMKEKVGCGSKL
jgi:hypothetical protein